MANPDLVKFIKEARKRGFEDYDIRMPLLKQGWNEDEVDKAFNSLKTYEGKIKLYISVDPNVLKVIEKRAKKNMFTTEEQIEDIIRRSSVNTSIKKFGGEKIDDLLVSVFSRKTRKKKQ